MDKLPSLPKIDRFLSNVLRGGLLFVIVFVLLGGALYLWRHGYETPNYKVFQGEPRDLKGIDAIVIDALHDKSLAIIQLGILLLIATPLARVVSCFLIFLYERDYLYVFISCLVLLILIYSLFWQKLP